ncbi:MAG: YceD family protein [Myxococcota bacterium]
MSFPVVALEAIPPHGLVVPVQDWARAACAEGLGGPVRSVGGELRVTRVGRDVDVRGELHGAAQLRCDRCGELADLALDTEVSCLYLAPRGEDEPLPEDDAAELGEYDGVALDLAHVIAESFALERPPRVLCGDLDPGQDAACLARYKARSGAPPPEPDPRLSALKGFKPAR